MAELTLYTNPMSRGRLARWMLEEAGADYDTVLLDYASTMKQQPYLSINRWRRCRRSSTAAGR